MLRRTPSSNPTAGTIDYGAAKAALVNVTKALSQEFGPKGIRINDVSPGPVATDLWRRVMLASPRTAYVTGSNYVIDGGLIKTL